MSSKRVQFASTSPLGSDLSMAFGIGDEFDPHRIAEAKVESIKAKYAKAKAAAKLAEAELAEAEAAAELAEAEDTAELAEAAAELAEAEDELADFTAEADAEDEADVEDGSESITFDEIHESIIQNYGVPSELLDAYLSKHTEAIRNENFSLSMTLKDCNADIKTYEKTFLHLEWVNTVIVLGQAEEVARADIKLDYSQDLITSLLLHLKEALTKSVSPRAGFGGIRDMAAASRTDKGKQPVLSIAENDTTNDEAIARILQAEEEVVDKIQENDDDLAMACERSGKFGSGYRVLKQLSSSSSSERPRSESEALPPVIHHPSHIEMGVITADVVQAGAWDSLFNTFSPYPVFNFKDRRTMY
jgi:multidrug efflux pump subunit AcrA (membrane-fusion protein)